jgi:hypothetical protein
MTKLVLLLFLFKKKKKKFKSIANPRPLSEKSDFKLWNADRSRPKVVPPPQPKNLRIAAFLIFTTFIMTQTHSHFTSSSNNFKLSQISYISFNSRSVSLTPIIYSHVMLVNISICVCSVLYAC